ncbi:alpha/beta hydrolase [Agromyces seonyuensis]|uniref:Phospholipase n=1 Tax=Agromyces seonyuensis TaxID=2662446 RepID=A0A6I4P1F4_9MICO|nr:alpha/beta hydrolase-fold protein [Agromyces seonyuensis]MWC00202.1 phospholipase [Agromyces seonyuensis]
MRIDDDAVLWSASEADRADRPLLLLLHGYNSNESDLFGLAPFLPLEPALASLRAPIDAGYGYAWFPLMAQGMDAAIAGARASAQAVLDWLDRTVPTQSGIGLLGFSQGGAMALELLRLDPDRFSYAVNLSGFALPGEREADGRLEQDALPVFWGRGTADQVIAADAIAGTIDWLPAHSTLDARIYEGLAHGISQPELADVVGFIRAVQADA